MAALRELVLKLFGRNILAVVGDDQVLFASDKEKESVLVYHAVITGLEPAVVKCGGGSLGILVISLHDICAADIYLAHAVLIGIVYLYLITRKRSADAAGLVVVHCVGCNCGRALGDAVAVEYLDTEIIESLLILGIQCRATDNDELKLAAELLMHLREELAAHINTEFQQETAYLDSLF